MQCCPRKIYISTNTVQLDHKLFGAAQCGSQIYRGHQIICDGKKESGLGEPQNDLSMLNE